MNGLGLSELKPGAVAITVDGKIAVVVRHDLNRPRRPICVKVKVDGPVYVAGTDYFRAVVGQVDLVAFEKLSTPVPAPVLAEREPMFGSGVMPDKIRDMNLKAGDQIRVKHGGRIVTAIFQGFQWSRPKYPVSYTINGKRWKGPMDGIVGKAIFGSGEAVTPEIGTLRLNDQSAADARAEALAS